MFMSVTYMIFGWPVSRISQFLQLRGKDTALEYLYNFQWQFIDHEASITSMCLD
jgi:hypothetical protein